MNESVALPAIKPLDFVRPLGVKDTVGIVSEVSHTYAGGACSIDWITNDHSLHNAWWEFRDLELVGSLPRLLAKGMRHPFGDGAKAVDEAFPERSFVGAGRSEEEDRAAEAYNKSARKAILKSILFSDGGPPESK